RGYSAARRTLGRDERILWHMRDPTGEIRLAAGDDEVVLLLHDAGGEHDIAQIHLFPEGLGQPLIRLEQRLVTGGEDLPRLLRVEQRPVGAVDADDLLRLDAVPKRQPAALARHLGQDRRSAAPDPRGRGGPGMRTDARLDMR